LETNIVKIQPKALKSSLTEQKKKLADAEKKADPKAPQTKNTELYKALFKEAKIENEILEKLSSL
jgi:hypothetical protein